MAMWVYREGNQNKPPVNEQQMVELIKSGVITGSTYVCDSDTRKWILASNSKFAMLIKREEALRQQQQQLQQQQQFQQAQQVQQNRFTEQQPSRFVEQQPNQVRNTGNKGKYIVGGIAIVAACVVSFIAGRTTAPKGVADVSGGIVPPTEVRYENQFVPELDTSVPDDLLGEQTESTETVVESIEETTETVVDSVFSSSGLDGTTETEQESLSETTPETEIASESETSTEETVGN